MIRSYKGKLPRIAASAYIDEAAVIIGDVEIGEDSSVWPCTVIRGDVHWIKLGKRTNVQDGCVLHVMRDEWPLELGDNVTIGHGVILHGCKIESRVLVGMGCTIMNGARIGTGSIIAAGTLIPEGAIVPPGSLFMGHPGKIAERTYGERPGVGGYVCAEVCGVQRDLSRGSGEIILPEKVQIRAIKGVSRDILPPRIYGLGIACGTRCAGCIRDVWICRN